MSVSSFESGGIEGKQLGSEMRQVDVELNGPDSKSVLLWQGRRVRCAGDDQAGESAREQEKG